MKNYVKAVMTGNVEGMDGIEKSIVNLEIGRLDQEIDWTAIKNIDMEQVEKNLRVLYPKGWTSIYFSVRLSIKVFMNHTERTYREFYESLNEEEIDYMNASFEQGIEGAMRIAG